LPQGLARLESLWNARFSGYTLPGHPGAFAYLQCAVIGAVVIATIAWTLGWWFSRSTGGRPSFFEKTLSGAQHFLATLFLIEEIPRRPGLLQKIDPRVKLLTIGASIILTTLTPSLRALVLLYALTLLLTWAARFPVARFMLRTWFFVPLFTAAMVAPVIFKSVTPGRAIYT